VPIRVGSTTCIFSSRFGESRHQLGERRQD
jgi:hypothetical protein